MRMTRLSVQFAAITLICASAYAAEPEPTAVVYRAAKLIDGRGGEVLLDQILVVKNQRIVAIGDADSIAIGADAQIVDLGESTIIPGLINSHLHMAAPPDRAYAEALMKRNLYAGVTAIRSMGDDVRAISDLARSAQLGEIDGPDIGYAAFFAGPGFFQDRRLQASAQGLSIGEIPWMREIRADTDLPEAVTLARGAGVSGIKIYANLPAPRVAELVEQAHAQGLRAWAHGAVFPASSLDVAKAGADSLSHICMMAYQGQPMPTQYHDRADVDESRFEDEIPAPVQQVFKAMAERGSVLDATVYVYETIERMRSQLPPGKGPPIYCSADLSRRLVAEAHRLGVAISAGTDAPAPLDQAFPAAFREMEILLDDAQMEPLQVLRAASWNGARGLGWEDQMGTLEVGKLANFVVLEKDPRTDLMGALRSVQRVVKRGRSYLRSDYEPIDLEQGR